MLSTDKRTGTGNASSDRAYDYIRRQILSGEYEPGKPLITNLLSEEIGVSRTPVRDALRQLESDGLVIIRPRLGASVKSMDLKEFEEMNELRLALECHAVGLAAERRTQADLEAMKVSLEAIGPTIENYIANYHGEPVPRELIREDIQFHVAIVNAARNDLMKREIFRLQLIHRVVAAPSAVRVTLRTSPQMASVAKQREVAAEHREIYQAISDRNPAAAKSAMERHLLNIIHANLHAMARSESQANEKELTKELLDLSP
jgi:DNA-binding GntR family transcriptional regulator